MRITIPVLIIFLLFSISPPNLDAVVGPLSYPNNKFGIHITDTTDLEDSAYLVNSSGGDWGYATIVIRQDERDFKRWQEVFDKMRRLHLIPIIRIASLQEEGVWTKPKNEEINNWIAFLNSLNWVIKNRYIIIGNEPNHATEWGGEVEPVGYAKYLIEFSKALKEASDDFFVLPAALDASAPDLPGYMSEEKFIRAMIASHPDLFDYIDGWASHSYPNPNFSGSILGKGKGTVRTFEWEIKLLKSLNIKKDLPIFITETGWAHNGTDKNSKYKDEKEIGNLYKEAFLTVWNSREIVAVTPFILNYQEEPFKKFSWKKDSNSYYDFFNDVKNIEKPRGYPFQINKYEVITDIRNPIRFYKNLSFGTSIVKNTGQKIWNEFEFFDFSKVDGRVIVSMLPKTVEPGHLGLIFYTFSDN